MINGFLFATLSPLFFGLADMSHKHVLSRQIRNGMSYMVLWGGIQLAGGIMLALFLDWKAVTFGALLFPMFSGFLYGIDSFLYINLLETEEASHVLGLVYLYPAVTALLSWIFLKEVYGTATYAGVFLIILGVMYLSVKLNRRTARRSVFAYLLIGSVIGLHCFLVKMATISLTVPQAVSVDMMALGATMMFALVRSPVRHAVVHDVRHLPWALLGNIELLGQVCSYLAMARLPATIVSSMGVLQMVVVIGCEQYLRQQEEKGGQGCLSEAGALAERRLRPKLVPLFMIMAGVSIISSEEVYILLVMQ